MADVACKELIDNVGHWIFDLPDAEMLVPLIKMRFSENESGFLSNFPHGPSTLEDLSRIFEMAPQDLPQIMEPMIRKGFIYRLAGNTAIRFSKVR
jgi:hypothetical protein